MEANSRGAFRQAIVSALPGSLVMAVFTALVIAPSFTIFGGILTLLLLATVYPLLLLVAYGILGFFSAVRATGHMMLPRWRFSLVIGCGAALSLTLVQLATALLLALALVGLFLSIGKNSAATNPQSLHDSLQFTAALGAACLGIITIYLVGAALIGLPCAWFGAWLAIDLCPRLTDTQNEEITAA